MLSSSYKERKFCNEPTAAIFSSKPAIASGREALQEVQASRWVITFYPNSDPDSDRCGTLLLDRVIILEQVLGKKRALRAATLFYIFAS
jgi:hypothetical protein